jgi:hypothetical protein
LKPVEVQDVTFDEDQVRVTAWPEVIEDWTGVRITEGAPEFVPTVTVTLAGADKISLSRGPLVQVIV